MLQKIFIYSLIVFHFAQAGAQQNPINTGVDAYAAGDEQAAHQAWSELAEQGDIRAQFYLSILYGDGQGVYEHRETALKWLRRAAENGSPAAQFNLGHHFIQGRWLDKNPSQAIYWWTRAADNGWADAQYNLATIYLRGVETAPDPEQAAYWYRQAVVNGSAEAKKALSALERQAAPANAYAATAEQTQTQAKESITENGSDWVLQQPGEHLTLQIYSSAEDDACLRVARELGQRLEHRMAVFPYQKRNKRFCAVLLGSFTTLDQARLASGRLPEGIRDGKPITRRFSTLQQMTRKP